MEGGKDKIHLSVSLNATKLSKVSASPTFPDNIIEEERDLIQLRLLDEAPTNQAPRWMKYYHIVSYVVYAIIALYSVFYLIYIGIYQAHPRMQIQFVFIIRFLEYNSYSILSPLLCPVFMGLLAYHVKKRYLLDEGDFFGLIGFLLLLSLVNVHDAWGIRQQLIKKQDYDRSTKTLEPPPIDNGSTDVYHWQYAWSTRTPCAKVFVRNLVYQQEYDKKHLKRQIVLDFGSAKERALEEEAASEASSKLQCNMYHDINTSAGVRQWMIDLQKEFKCCGPYGFKLWRRWFISDERTGCDLSLRRSDGDIPGCYEPMMKWLNNILNVTFWIMNVQALLYIVAITFAVAHHRVMRFEQLKSAKPHSLLDMTKPPDEEPWWRATRPARDPMVIGNNLFKEQFALEPHQRVKDEKGAVTVTESDTKQENEKHAKSDDKSVAAKKKVRT